MLCSIAKKSCRMEILLMIVKNNYFWTENFEETDFLANGEFVEVVRIRNTEQNVRFQILQCAFAT